jgi:hypothetical protein
MSRKRSRPWRKLWARLNGKAGFSVGSLRNSNEEPAGGHCNEDMRRMDRTFLAAEPVLIRTEGFLDFEIIFEIGLSSKHSELLI